jgi:hypothetical protein
VAVIPSNPCIFRWSVASGINVESLRPPHRTNYGARISHIYISLLVFLNVSSIRQRFRFLTRGSWGLPATKWKRTSSWDLNTFERIIWVVRRPKKAWEALAIDLNTRHQTDWKCQKHEQQSFSAQSRSVHAWRVSYTALRYSKSFCTARSLKPPPLTKRQRV